MKILFSCEDFSEKSFAFLNQSSLSSFAVQPLANQERIDEAK